MLAGPTSGVTSISSPARLRPSTQTSPPFRRVVQLELDLIPWALTLWGEKGVHNEQTRYPQEASYLLDSSSTSRWSSWCGLVRTPEELAEEFEPSAQTRSGTGPSKRIWRV